MFVQIEMDTKQENIFVKIYLRLMFVQIEMDTKLIGLRKN